MIDIKPGKQSFYSAAQVQAYMQRINFPGSTSSFYPNLRNLEQLVRLHLVAFPFENSRLHYTSAHEVDVSPQYVYDRLVEKRQGGSWCCGHNGLLLGMLRGLGYRGYASAARVNFSPPKEVATDFTFLSHLVLLVQLDDTLPDEDERDVVVDVNFERPKQKTYLVDVGYGGTGIVRPMLLQVGQIVPGAAAPEEHRLVWGIHPESSLQENEFSREWVLQYRCGSHQPEWGTQYIFKETESYPGDWIALSQWLCAHPVEVFVHNVVCIRYFIVEDTAARDNGQEEPLGRLIMTGKRVQSRVGAQSQTVKEFSTESERIRILKDDFGILVEEHEVENIANTPAALPP